MKAKKGQASKQPIDRKRQIIDAAIECFVKSGVAHTRFNEIAKAAKVDQPLIHYYFPTLDSLYVEVVARVLESLKNESLKAIEKNAGDPLKVLIAYTRVPFEWGQKYPGYNSLWAYFYYLATFHQTFIQLNKSIRETGRERISVILYKGMEKGVFKNPKNISVSQMALTIQGIITGNALLAGTEGLSSFKEYTDITVQAVLRVVEAA
jgi:AcrR family transcriptional regulator